ncbi:MAG: hypothetical protein EOP61_10800 [Sphingomonadales bacterium]|nr:MAG: hypothetical protein EOP61_10800 [Sphingomonadales bacterium]
MARYGAGSCHFRGRRKRDRLRALEGLPMLAMLLAAASLPCAMDHARYVLRADPQVSLSFHVVGQSADWRSELAANIRLDRTGRSSWWLPTQSGSSDPRFLRWTGLVGSPEAAPGYRYTLHDLRYFAFDAGYAMINKTPYKGDPAPAHILLADLRDAFYYSDDPATRSSPPQSLFDLTGCDVPDDRPGIFFPLAP